LRKRSLAAPAIVVAEGAGFSPESLELGPDDCVLSPHAVLRDLPAAVKRVMDRSQPADPPNQESLAQKLAEAQSALERAERVRAADAAASADQIAQRSQAFTLSLGEVVRSRDALDQRLIEATRTLEQLRQDHDAEAAAAGERQLAIEQTLSITRLKL